MTNHTDDITALAQLKLTELGALQLLDLAALFLAIRAAAPDHSQPKRLANVGMYLCEDWIAGWESISEPLRGQVGKAKEGAA